MTWDNVKDAIGKTAPILGGLVGGSVGASVGTLISSVLGVDNTPDAVIKELQSNPTAFLRLKEIETSHRQKLEELRIESMKLELQDIASARNRQIESEKATGKKDYNLYVLAWFIVISYGFLIYTLLTTTIPRDESGVLYMLLGTLATSFVGVIQYFFGSSAGSRDKSIQIASMKKEVK